MTMNDMGDVSVKYSKELYDKDVLIKAAYAMSDKVYIHLDVDKDNYLVEFSSKDLNDSNDYNRIFENELLAQQTRKIISNKTQQIRGLITARALSSTIVELKESNESNESGFDSESILKDWFEENE